MRRLVVVDAVNHSVALFLSVKHIHYIGRTDFNLQAFHNIVKKKIDHDRLTVETPFFRNKALSHIIS